MAAMKLPSNSPTSILRSIELLLGSVSTIESDDFSWSPAKKAIQYNKKALSTDEGIWSLLHEAGHAKLDHNDYTSDFELLRLETMAWDEAKLIARPLNIVIDDNHIQDCLDTYRDWLHARSTCPTCSVTGIQRSKIEYRCHNCHTHWKVSGSKFCRPYRKKSGTINPAAHTNSERVTFK